VIVCHFYHDSSTKLHVIMFLRFYDMIFWW